MPVPSAYFHFVSKCDHLFVNYATEDWAFAEWLTLRLTAEGYRVWCDRFELLGGESYPKEVGRAIADRTFRFLAVISKNSIDKPNPLKERTLALNIAKDRKEDFLIPLNLDGLSPTEVGWMLSDLSWIPFTSWSRGFAQLLKKLQSLNAPRPLEESGRRVVADWFAGLEKACDRPERLWSNLLEFREYPSRLLRIRFEGPPSTDLLSRWPHYRENDLTFWSFDLPVERSRLDVEDIRELDWQTQSYTQGLRLRDVATALIKRSVQRFCLNRGMEETADGAYLYFPAGLVPGDRLPFTRYDGYKTWVRAVGERTFLTAQGREKSRYHLAPVFRPTLLKDTRPLLQVQMRVHLTDLSGKPLENRKLVRRRKSICRDWWNYEWLARLLAVLSWMADGSDSISLLPASSRRIVLAATPVSVAAPFGIDERTLEPFEVDEEAEVDESEHELPFPQHPSE